MEMKEKLYGILREEFNVSKPISPETNLIDEFGFESLSLVELASQLEQETGVKVKQSEAIQWTTVDSVLRTFCDSERKM